MRYELSWEPRGLHVIYQGAVTSQGIAEAVRAFQADVRYDSLRYILHDASGCVGASFSDDELLEIAATDRAAAATNPNARVAVIATHPEMLALTRQYLSASLNRHELRIFATQPEARRWACDVTG